MNLKWVALSFALAACDQGAKPIDRPSVITSSQSEASIQARDAGRDAAHEDAGRDAAPEDAAKKAACAGFSELPENNTGNDQKCVKLVVGAAEERAVLCDEVHYGYWTITHQFVRVVRGGKSVRVLDIPTKIEGFDNGAKYLELRLRIACDGMSATTIDGVPAPDAGQGSDRSARGQDIPMGSAGPQWGPDDNCERAPNSYDDTGRALGETPYGVFRRRLCKARGDYRWDGDRFVHIKH
jgi:hypothetical protein